MRRMCEEMRTPERLRSVEGLLQVFARGIRRRLTTISSAVNLPKLGCLVTLNPVLRILPPGDGLP